MTADEITVSCPAKINLHLEILGRRADGFHEVETVMHSIDISDGLVFKHRAEGIRIRCDCDSVPSGDDNLVHRAMTLVSAEAGLRRGADVVIKKNIPPGSGLGGGSSNAAGAIIGANRLWGLGLTRDDAGRLGKKLGTDVSFFTNLINEDFTGFRGGAFLGRGRGDEMAPIRSIPGIFMVLAVPPAASRTADAYGMLGAENPGRRRSAGDIVEAMEKGDIGKVSRRLFNRLEDVVLRGVPWVGKVRDGLRSAGAESVLMTGSGSGVFAFTPGRAEAAEIARRVRARWKEVKVYVTCTT